MDPYTYTPEDVDRFMAAALQLMDQTGALIRSAINKVKRIDNKESCHGDGNSSEVLTETDSAVEHLIVKALKTQFNDHCFIGEEDVSGAVGDGMIPEFPNKPTWIIDPIDGTMNFVHKNPLVCTSVGLAINRKVVAGIVDCPLVGLRYTAVKGKGAFLNDEPLSVSGTKSLKDAMVILEIPVGANEEKQAKHIETISMLMTKAEAIRCPGPAAMDICFIGAGSADVFFHSGIHCWDVAAGALIVTEAGGSVTSLDGSDFDLMSRQILCASSPELIREMAGVLDIYQAPAEFTEKCPM